MDKNTKKLKMSIYNKKYNNNKNNNKMNSNIAHIEQLTHNPTLMHIPA